MRSHQQDADEAIAVLARTRGRALVGYAFLLTGDQRDAEDLVQDAMVRTFGRSRPIDPAAAEGYVRRAVLNAYIDGYRRRRLWLAARHLLAREDSQPTDDPSDRLDLRSALRALPPQQRACVVLRFYDDLTVAEVADRLGLATGTVKRYLSLAVRRLEDLLGPLEAPTDDNEPRQTHVTHEKGI